MSKAHTGCLHAIWLSLICTALLQIASSEKQCFDCTYQRSSNTWPPCKASIPADAQTSLGIEATSCDTACFTKIEKNGDIRRGCYDGTYGVSPTLLGCHIQGYHKALYCFCDGDKCNKNAPQEYAEAAGSKPALSTSATHHTVYTPDTQNKLQMRAAENKQRFDYATIHRWTPTPKSERNHYAGNLDSKKMHGKIDEENIHQRAYHPNSQRINYLEAQDNNKPYGKHDPKTTHQWASPAKSQGNHYLGAKDNRKSHYLNPKPTHQWAYPANTTDDRYGSKTGGQELDVVHRLYKPSGESNTYKTYPSRQFRKRPLKQAGFIHPYHHDVYSSKQQSKKEAQKVNIQEKKGSFQDHTSHGSDVVYGNKKESHTNESPYRTRHFQQSYHDKDEGNYEHSVHAQTSKEYVNKDEQYSSHKDGDGHVLSHHGRNGVTREYVDHKQHQRVANTRIKYGGVDQTVGEIVSNPSVNHHQTKHFHKYNVGDRTIEHHIVEHYVLHHRIKEQLNSKHGLDAKNVDPRTISLIYQLLHPYKRDKLIEQTGNST